MPMSPRLLRPRAAGGFDPRALGGLAYWLDGADRATMFDAVSGGAIVADNGAVARWEDKSGNGNHAVQATANDRPLVRPSTRGSRSAMEFDGSSDFMRIPDAASVDFNAFTLFAVVRFSVLTTSAFTAILNKGDYTSAAGTNYELTMSGNNQFSAGIASGGTFTSVGASGTRTASVNQWHLVAARRAVASAATVFEGRQSGGSTSVVSGTLNNASAGVGIGARGTGTPSLERFPGNMAEILGYNFALSDAQMTTIYDYLAAKWSL